MSRFRIMSEGGKESSQGSGNENFQNMAQMFQAMTREFVTAITDLRRDAPREEERGCPFKRFERLQIPSFDGKRDPMECENWLIDTEEILRLAGCTEEQKVQYTTYRFSGEARNWWVAKKVLLIQELGSEEAISWQRFQKEFLQQYFPKFSEMRKPENSWISLKEI